MYSRVLEENSTENNFEAYTTDVISTLNTTMDGATGLTTQLTTTDSYIIDGTTADSYTKSVSDMGDVKLSTVTIHTLTDEQYDDSVTFPKGWCA